MVFACQLTPAEMREAFRMNLTAGFWTRTVLRNLRAMILIYVVVFSLGAKLMHGESVEWKAIAGTLGLAVVLIGFFLWRLSSGINKTAAQVNVACASFMVDSSGVPTTAMSGAVNFLPWTEIRRWKEGTLVYTLGEAKAYKVIPKRVLTPMQLGELQGMLQMYVRPR